MSVVQRLLTEHIDIWTAADTERKSGRGRGSGSAGSVYGVKKLRELILELAVRGKLVPQDRNDEPATELLKRIRSEAALSRVGKKTETPASDYGSDNSSISDRLPSGWAKCCLGEVADIIRGITFPASEKSKMPAKGRLACLRTSNIQDRIEWGDLLFIREEFVARPDQILKFGDIVMSMANSRELVGKVALVAEELSQKTCFGGFLGVIRPHIILPRYLMAVLRTPSCKNALIESASQTTNIANISLAKLRPLEFFIPPIAEQRRIVAKVDELMVLCDQLEAQHSDASEAHEKLVGHLLGTLTNSTSAEDFTANWQRISEHFDTLFTSETSIDKLKQTLIQLAVMGKLVPQDESEEPATEIVKRIAIQKSKLSGAARSRIDKPLTAISEEEKPFSIASGWEWLKLGSALEITGGVTLGRKITGSDLIDLPYLRVANVQRGALDLSEIKHVEIRSSELDRYQLLEGDLLVTEGGDWDKVGRTATWNSELPQCVHQNHIFRMRKICEGISSAWVEMYMNSVAKAYFQKASKQTTNLASINMTQLKNCVLAIPPSNEQTRIIAKVADLIAHCDQVKTRLSDANNLQRKLADVLVAQAMQ